MTLYETENEEEPVIKYLGSGERSRKLGTRWQIVPITKARPFGSSIKPSCGTGHSLLSDRN